MCKPAQPSITKAIQPMVPPTAPTIGLTTLPRLNLSNSMPTAIPPAAPVVNCKNICAGVSSIAVTIDHTVTVRSIVKISVLAKAVDCHVETVRYYEKKGILPPCDRAPNGYGEYSDTHLRLLRLIRYAKALGFSQVQIRDLVRLATNRGRRCDEAHRLIIVQLDLIQEKMESLKNLKKCLTQISSDCKRSDFTDCSVFDQIMGGTR